MDRDLSSSRRAEASRLAHLALLREPPQPKMKVLVIDIGGTNVKLIATHHLEPRRFESGPTLTPKRLVSQVRKMVSDWQYDVISIGYPGKVHENRPISEPRNLGRGWKGFNFEKAFKVPVKVLNDAAMQALGSYKGGKMLFLGLGTGLGSAIVLGGIAQPMELGHLPYKKGTFENYVGCRGLEKYGQKEWRRNVKDVIERLMDALAPEDVVMGGGNARKLARLPKGCRAGHNYYAFLGGFRLWTETKSATRKSRQVSRKRRSIRRQTTLRRLSH